MQLGSQASEELTEMQMWETLVSVFTESWKQFQGLQTQRASFSFSHESVSIK